MIGQAETFAEEKVYYLILRSKKEERIFQEEKDYRDYLNLTRDYTLKFNFNLICFLLLPNQAHLLLRPNPNSDIFNFVHLISFPYRGVLEGEPEIKIVEKGPYLLELTCYLHLKPVRSNLVEKAEDYPFSSYPMYIGKNNGLDLEIAYNEVIEQISLNRQEGINLYQQFIESGCFGKPETLKVKLENSIIGSEEFIRKIKQRQGMALPEILCEV